jgi:hypothetical protein
MGQHGVCVNPQWHHQIRRPQPDDHDYRVCGCDEVSSIDSSGDEGFTRVSGSAQGCTVGFVEADLLVHV